VAAGNRTTWIPLLPLAKYPCSWTDLKGLLCVASTDSGDLLDDTSNYGNAIDLTAPGSGICTTNKNGGYSAATGTSFAAPHVSGAAAVLWSMEPNLTVDQVADRLMKTADNIDAKNKTYAGMLGSGRLNLFEAVAPVHLTSITLDPENADGETTNAPGAWSTNTADPLAQLGVVRNGVFLNSKGAGFDLGEISISLHPGRNDFDLYGNGRFDNNLYYGAVLFFNGVATPPQVAVFNSNGGTGSFSVQTAGKTIMGGANGGLFFDNAPGTKATCIETSAGAFTVEVVEFTVTSKESGTDMVNFYNKGADQTLDTVAHLALNLQRLSSPCPDE